MARPIKITEEQIEAVIADFRQKIKGTTMSGGKFEYSKTFEFLNRKANVFISELAWLKMNALVREFSTEIGWYGLCTRADNEKFPDSYVIYDILVPPQQVDGSKVDTDPEEFDKWLDSLPDEQFKDLHYQGHSHVDWSASPSTTDTSMYVDTVARIKTDSFYVFNIMNKKGSQHWEIYDLKTNLFFDTSDITFQIIDTGLGVQKLVTEAKEVVKKKSTLPVYKGWNNYNYSGSSYGGPYYDGTKAGKDTGKSGGKADSKTDVKSGGKGKDSKKKGTAKKKGKDDIEFPKFNVKVLYEYEGKSEVIDSGVAHADESVNDIIDIYGFDDIKYDIKAKINGTPMTWSNKYTQFMYLPDVCGIKAASEYEIEICVRERGTASSKGQVSIFDDVEDEYYDDPDGPYSAFGHT